MNLLNYFSRKIPFSVCIAASIALLFASAGIGLGVNQFRHQKKPTPATTQTPPMGIINVDLTKARELFDQRILFVDARSKADFAEGHIPGAVNLDFYDFDNEFTGFSTAVTVTTPIAVYCSGINGPDTCETSAFLAGKLFDYGYQSIYLFEEGYSFWVNGGNPVEARPAQQAVAKPSQKKMTPWAYTRDLSMLVFGIFTVLLYRKKPVIALMQIVLGTVFIISGAGKILHPEKLQVIIDAYRIMPKSVTPFMSMVMPWIEVLSGAALITGIIPAAGALVISGMNLAFIPALTYRALFMARESGIPFTKVDFDCGCGLGENFAWVLILRDVGYLLMGVVILFSLVQLQKSEKK